MGSSTTTQTIQSPQQIALQAKQLAQADEQLKLIKEQAAFQRAAYEEAQPFLEEQQAEVLRQQERARALEPIQDELLQLQLDEIRRGGAASPEQIAAIDEASTAAQARGEIDVERFRTENLDALANQLAPALGLRPGDTPILDRGGRIAAEAQRQQGALTESLANSSAMARLNYPLAAAQAIGAQSQFQQGLAQSQQQFQAQLRDAALNNRLRAAGTFGGLGVSLANAASPGVSSFQPLGQTTTTNPGLVGGITTGLGGIGGLLTGLGAIGVGGGA